MRHDCNWCGKPMSYIGYCSTKCQSEHDRYRGISPAQRSEINKTTTKNAWGCMFLLGIICLVFGIVFPNGQKTTSSGSSSQGNTRRGQPMMTYRCTQCRKLSDWVYIGTKPDYGSCYPNGGHNWVSNH